MKQFKINEQDHVAFKEWKKLKKTEKLLRLSNAQWFIIFWDFFKRKQIS